MEAFARSNNEIPIDGVFRKLTVDVISKVAFQYELNASVDSYMFQVLVITVILTNNLSKYLSTLLTGRVTTYRRAFKGTYAKIS